MHQVLDAALQLVARGHRVASSLSAAALSGVVQKSSVDVHAERRLDAARVVSLKRDTAVSIATQQGLWY